MAYYSSSYYIDDDGEYNSDYPVTPCSNNFDSTSVQDSTFYSSYNSSNYQNFSYDSIPFFAADDHPVSSYLKTGYSVSTYSEPRCIEYEQAPHYSVQMYESASHYSVQMYDPAPQYSSQTRFVISYSVSEFNETDFEEYDPTPYGGGYDQTHTYGKPLPPSDEICYPRSASLNGVSSGVVTTPVAKEVADEHATKPQDESKPTAEEAEQHQQLDKAIDLLQGEENKEKYIDDRSSPWSGYENGSRGQDVYECEKQVAQIPSGYGLEAMDLCEGIFGYWPCLSHYGKRWADCQEIAADCGNHNYRNQWKGAADYLFGSTYPYGYRRDDDHAGSYGNVMYGYQRQYQQLPLYHQVDDFWSA